jgi:hypothetical protein
MITLAFAILMVVSSWYSWRRNPMYSRRRTLHWMLAIGLSIAAAIGLFIAVVQLTQRYSKEVQMGAIFGAVFVATIALIAIIVSITTPKTAPIPANTRLLTLHRRRLIAWLKAAGETTLILAVIALVPYVFPGKVANVLQFIALFLGAWVVGLGGIMLAAGYVGALSLDRMLTAVEANAWVHWTYSTAEWNAWIEQQIAQHPAPSNRYTKKELILVAVIAIPLTLGTFLAGVASIGVILVVGLGAVLLSAGLMILIHRSAQNAPARLRRKLTAAPLETYLGPDGLFANGTYNPWLTTGVFLIEASIQTRPDASQPDGLLFRFEKVNPGADATILDQVVLIPAATDPAVLAPLLHRLQRELDSVAKTARVRLA